VSSQPGTTVELCARKLHALLNPYELDGRVSTHPPEARGFASMNAYLLLEDDRALLIDTGVTIHQDALLAQLERLLPPDASLSLWILRLGEFNAVCNAKAIVDRFTVDAIYALQNDALGWIDFHPGGSPVAAVPSAIVRSTRGGVNVGRDGRRPLRTLEAPLRLLPTYWVYDEATKTLFSSDAFGYAAREGPEGPWVITSVDDDPTTRESIRTHLTRTRFWWLPGARTEPLRRALAETFETYDIQTIAPGFGCVLHGRDVVEHHVQMLDDVLASAEDDAAVGIAVGQWRRSER
jgi:hypothetical protein